MLDMPILYVLFGLLLGTALTLIITGVPSVINLSVKYNGKCYRVTKVSPSYHIATDTNYIEIKAVEIKRG